MVGKKLKRFHIFFYSSLSLPLSSSLHWSRYICDLCILMPVHSALTCDGNMRKYTRSMQSVSCYLIAFLLHVHFLLSSFFSCMFFGLLPFFGIFKHEILFIYLLYTCRNRKIMHTHNAILFDFCFSFISFDIYMLMLIA